LKKFLLLLIGYSLILGAETYQARYEALDTKLNKLYTEILSQYKEDSVFINRFTWSQKAWAIFRDGQMRARFPLDTNPTVGLISQCAYTELIELTKGRISQLNN
jgi:uncharacterized protein YecT (DUF1311 family)